MNFTEDAMKGQILAATLLLLGVVTRVGAQSGPPAGPPTHQEILTQIAVLQEQISNLMKSVAIAGGNEARQGNPISYPAFYASQIDGVMAVAAVTPSGE